MTRRSIVLILRIVQGLAAFIWLAILPTTAEKGMLFGFSLSRLALLGISASLTGISIFFFWYQRKLTGKFIKDSLTKSVYRLSILICAISLLSMIILRALGMTTGYIYTAYAGRLAPLAFWFGVSALELAIMLAYDFPDSSWKNQQAKTILIYALWILAILVVIVVFVAITKIGITPYNDGSWGVPTTPLLEWQILLALCLSVAVMALRKQWHWLQKDRYNFLLIYIITCLIWLSQPVNPGYFATPPRAPNFEIYPFSDGLIYAQYAQSALVGNGFMWPDVPTRPLYITFLTWLHAIAGQDYNHVIALQTIVLAVFPAILYLLGKEIAGQEVGYGIALLAILRDLTANIAAPFANNYTYTKLFFSEIPAALLISLFTLLIIRWVKQPKPAWFPLLAGGILGLCSLIRLQSAILLLAAIPIAFFAIKNKKKFFSGTFLIVTGLILALAPWLVRNYKATGGLVLDNPISQTMVLARRWSGDNGNTLFPHLPGESESQYSSRMAGLAITSLRTDPGRILGSAVNHFFNNVISTLFVFPLRDQLDSPGDLIWPTRAFWQSWAGQPAAGQIPLIGLCLILLSAGLAFAFQRNGVIGLLPLALNLVYNAWTALFLSSGDRFLVPVDWAIYLYLFLGLLSLISLIFNISVETLFQKPAGASVSCGIAFPVSWKNIGLTALFIVLCGASLPITELVFPQKYIQPTGRMPTGRIPAGRMPADTTQPQLITVSGRALYPRWYAAGDGEPGSAKLGYGKSDQDHLVFFLTGQRNALVILPISPAPKYFPNAADVTITGSLVDGVLNAQKIVIQLNNKSAEYTR